MKIKEASAGQAYPQFQRDGRCNDGMVNGIFVVIDAHCHIYPDKLAQKAERAVENFYHFNGFGDGTVGMLLREGKNRCIVISLGFRDASYP